MARGMAHRRPRRVVITGASGFIGQHLVRHMESNGHEVLRVTRAPARPGVKTILWDPEARTIDAARLEGADLVVHLAGEPIGKRWTRSVKRRILESRRDGTQYLAEILAALDRKPRALLCASAVGYYGNRGDEALTESGGHGTGFLADVCQIWERAADPARRAGIRVVHLRQGIVLAPDGGALGRMLPAFKLGLGARLGSGRQYWSWIALRDLLGVYDHVAAQTEISGAVNAVAPYPVTNAAFTKTLARALARPGIARVPRPLVRALMGEMGQRMLLEGQRVLPARLQATGYRFQFPELEGALRAMLGRAPRELARGEQRVLERTA